MAANLKAEAEEDFFLDTNGNCFICRKDLSSLLGVGAVSNGGTFINKANSLPPSNGGGIFHSFQCVASFVNLDMGKVLDEFMSIPPYLKEKIKRSKLKVRLCGSCAEVTEQFSKLYTQLEIIKMEMSSYLSKIHKEMEKGSGGEGGNGAVRVPSSEFCQLTEGISLDLGKLVEKARQEALEKCSLKLQFFAVPIKSMSVSSLLTPNRATSKEQNASSFNSSSNLGEWNNNLSINGSIPSSHIFSSNAGTSSSLESHLITQNHQEPIRSHQHNQTTQLSQIQEAALASTAHSVSVPVPISNGNVKLEANLENCGGVGVTQQNLDLEGALPLPFDFDYNINAFKLDPMMQEKMELDGSNEDEDLNFILLNENFAVGDMEGYELIDESNDAEVNQVMAELFPEEEAVTTPPTQITDEGTGTLFCLMGCGRRFPSKMKLQYHEQRCELKPFPCAQCNKRFKKEPDLKRHLIFMHRPTSGVPEGKAKTSSSSVEFKAKEESQFSCSSNNEEIQIIHQNISAGSNVNSNPSKPKIKKKFASKANIYGCRVPGCLQAFNSPQRLEIHENRCRFKYEYEMRQRMVKTTEEGTDNSNDSSQTSQSSASHQQN